ncbi:MAG: site-specific DNA-methyltransferase [Firmicutes bacterium]|nr:site-specific DNA-methyltransferase [Bacillota bacterium]
MRSAKNKTLNLSEEQERKYLALCPKKYVSDDCVIKGDCMEIMWDIPHSSVDLMIVDPPYNMYKKFGSEEFSRQSMAEYEKYTRSWIERALPLLKKTASVYVCCDWFSGITIGAALADYFVLRNRITWQREKGRGALKNWKNGMEDVWFASVGDDYYFDVNAVKQRKKVIAPYRKDGVPKDWQEENGEKFRYTFPSNFWDDVTVPYWSMPENTPHPTQKPEKLLAKIILASSRPGDLVFDPFGGSGSTAVTAKKLGRRYLTIEKDEKYCAMAAYRLEKADSDKSVSGMKDGVFLPRNERFVEK